MASARLASITMGPVRVSTRNTCHRFRNRRRITSSARVSGLRARSRCKTGSPQPSTAPNATPNRSRSTRSRAPALKVHDHGSSSRLRSTPSSRRSGASLTRQTRDPARRHRPPRVENRTAHTATGTVPSCRSMEARRPCRQVPVNSCGRAPASQPHPTDHSQPLPHRRSSMLHGRYVHNMDQGISIDVQLMQSTLNSHVIFAHGRTVAIQTPTHRPAQRHVVRAGPHTRGEGTRRNLRHRRCMLARADYRVNEVNGSSEAPSARPSAPGRNRANAPHDPVLGDDLRRPASQGRRRPALTGARHVAIATPGK